MAELMQFTDKLQHITMMLQLHSTPQSIEEPVHKAVQAYMGALHATQREANITITLLHDIPTFDGQDYSKPENWSMDIETATDMLTERHTHLTEVKLYSLTHTLIHETLQTGKCWYEIKGILRLKFCNANINTYTSHFMEIQQKDNETFAAYIHHFKTAAKQCIFDNETAVICIYVKGLWDAHTTTAKMYEKDPQTLSEVIRLVENSMQHNN